MRTILTTSPEEAAEVIKNGGIVAFPTETVYGLGANAFDETAVSRIFEAKGRPADNPLIVHIADREQVNELASERSRAAEQLMEVFFPGPLTILFKKRTEVPNIVTAGLSTVGIRMPANLAAHDLLKKCRVPVAAPSANMSGRPSPTTWKAVLEDLDGRIDCILQGDPAAVGLESTVVDCSGDIPVVLRKGAIGLDELRKVCPETMLERGNDTEPPRSPGAKYRHYSPNAKVILFEKGMLPVVRDPNSAIIGIGQFEADGSAFVSRAVSVEEYARNVFEFFRECERRGITTIYCETVSEEGIGSALMDRLRRAGHS